MQFFSTAVALAALALGTQVMGAPLQTTANPATVLLERQGSCGITSPGTRLVGDGECFIDAMQSVSYSIGFSTSGTSSRISGGFDVSATFETGETTQCNGGRGETVCIWKVIQHTEYTVQNGTNNQCTGWTPSGNPERMTSPNNQQEAGFQSVHGTACRRQGDQYWF